MTKASVILHSTLNCLLLTSLIRETKESSLGGALYDDHDKITLLNATNFQSTICGSSTAWLVEFYSSWCGHCIHFAPTFKQLAEDVHSWRTVMAVGAIDCAQEQNMPTCREYDIMGYPTIKFFSPNTPEGDMGSERLNREKTVPSIETDMISYLTGLQLSGKAAASWPSLVVATVVGQDISNIWDGGARLAILLVEPANATLGSEVLLDMSQTLKELSVPLALAKIEISAQSDQLLQRLRVDRSKSSLVAVSRDFSTTEILSSQPSRGAWTAAIKDFIWKKSDLLSPKKGINAAIDNPSNEKKTGGDPVKPKKTATRKEVMARRYKAHLVDLEKAVLYAISHEVAQHSSITSHTLEALQKFVTVLHKYFPGRVEMTIFLRDLHGWVHKHQDTVRGEDLSAWFSSYQSQHGPGPHKEWLGCRGSEDRYGGYPCGLWAVWHALTVSQANLNEGDPKEVLLAMKGYIKEFFGCRECARHFDQAIEGGKLIEEEVKTYNDALLLLWRVHNKANQRLSGDISEDPVFPKLVFPSKEFCSSCYDATVTGTNLWIEFNKNQVLQFLKNLYSKEKLSSQGLIGASSDDEQHALVAVPAAQIEENVESFDTSNYKKEENSSNFIFFNGADLSICFVLWFISAVLLVLIYLKFVAGRKFSNSFFFNGIKRKSNPLLGKV